MALICTDVAAIDAVVNIMTDRALRHRPDDRRHFLSIRIGVDQAMFRGVAHEDMLRRMDAAGIEKACLVAAKSGPAGYPASSIPYTRAKTVEAVLEAAGRP
jgi:hypothetical protein